MSEDKTSDESGEGGTVASGHSIDPDERLDSDTGTFDIDAGEDGSDKESGTAGLPEQDDVPDETIEQIDKEREERLDPDNRPDNVEVDNTDRTFDAGAGTFTDSDEYDKDERPYAEEGDEPPAEADETPAPDESGDSDGDPEDR